MRASLSLLVLMGAMLMQTLAYLPPFVAGPNPAIGCDVTYSTYLQVAIDAILSPSSITYGGSSAFQSDPLSCPLKPNCRATSPATPFTCYDGSCAASPLDCNARASSFPCPASTLNSGNDRTKIRCWDGSCGRALPYSMIAYVPTAANDTFATLASCPPLPACRPNEMRCWDLSCRDATNPSVDPCAAYTFEQLTTYCSSLTSVTALSAYQCCGAGATPTPEICGAYYGCSLGQVQCPDGRCVLLEEYREGACSKGCPDGQVRCYGKLKGQCKSPSECTAWPSSVIISEFVATVGSQSSANSTRLALRDSADGSEIGYIAVPPLTSSGAVHYNVFNYMLGSQLNDASRSLESGEWRRGEYATTSVFSPIVAVLSYDLLLLYAGDRATNNPEAIKLVNSWALEVALPVQLPEGVPAKKVCLAYVDDMGGSVPVRGQRGWECIDREIELLDNATSLYRAYMPLGYLMATAPYTHMAFVHDASDDFGPVESIGGGFFAAGIALLVVGGTFLLANREKLMGRIYNDGGGTSTSAM